jgi:hypothetical protein
MTWPTPISWFDPGQSRESGGSESESAPYATAESGSHVADGGGYGGAVTRG